MFISGIQVLSLSIISILVSAQVLFYSGIIVDEVGLGGDAVSTYLFLAIVGFSILNPIIYFLRHRARSIWLTKNHFDFLLAGLFH
ncbi:hypothetical protein JOC86_004063 [Bacillus pakistanensis]|uniref:Uncharacterized protein n=1 Tax=Rossellomorea pakistanensis TaxID=992288 RepID=A0ABS2NHZ8_9BACI|nr:hypothetical protein [Bacillus pakistanensis]